MGRAQAVTTALVLIGVIVLLFMWRSGRLVAMLKAAAGSASIRQT